MMEDLSFLTKNGNSHSGAVSYFFVVFSKPIGLPAACEDNTTTIRYTVTVANNSASENSSETSSSETSMNAEKMKNANKKLTPCCQN